jgi:hypothetical protein
MDALIDKFIETMQGKLGKRQRIEYKNMRFSLSHMSDKDVPLLLHDFIQFLENANTTLTPIQNSGKVGLC